MEGLAGHQRPLCSVMLTGTALLLALLILLVAVLYSSVGHGGASGYLAVMALVGAVVGAFMVRHPERLSMGFTIAGVGMGVYLLGLVAPRSLVPVWQGWMKFAHYLGLVVTGILLVSMWVGIVVPIGILVRLLKVKIMDMRFRAPVSTYWEERDPALHDFKLLERQW